MTKTILDVQNLASGYGKLPIIENINTHVEDEQIVVIVGPNGAGKSTLLKSVFGLNRRIAGEISFHGQSILQQNLGIGPNGHFSGPAKSQRISDPDGGRKP